MTISNQTPFAKAVSSFLSHTIQTESKYCDVFVAMLEMEATFSEEWTAKFLKTSGEEKTEMLESTFRKIELEGYEKLLETAKDKLGKDASAEAKVAKEDAQKRTHALNMMLKTVAFALAGFQLAKVSKYEVKKGGRIRYVVQGAWEGGHKGESFSTLVSLGKARAVEANWTSAPKKQVNHVSGQPVPNGAAGSPVSSVETADKVVQSNGMIQPQAPNGKTAFVQVCEALRIMLKTKAADKLTESEQSELRNTERALVKYVFGDTKGKVDLDALFCAYEDDASESYKLIKGKKPSRQVSENPEDRREVA